MLGGFWIINNALLEATRRFKKISLNSFINNKWGNTMLFKFCKVLIVVLFLTNSLLGTKVTCRVLKSKKAKPIIVMYGDAHMSSQVEEQQGALIIENIEKVLEQQDNKNTIKTAILYEGISYSSVVRKHFMLSAINKNPLYVLTDYFEAFKASYDNSNGSIQIANIDNRNHLYSDISFLIREKLNGLIEESLRFKRIKSHAEFNKLIKLNTSDLYKIFYQDTLDNFNNLKASIEKSKNKFDLPTQQFFEQEIEKIERAIKSFDGGITISKICDFLGLNFFKERGLSVIESYSINMQDLNTLLYVLDHPEVDKYIIFVGEGHAQKLASLFSDQFSFEEVYSHNLLDKPEINIVNGNLLGLAKMLANEDFSLFNEDFNLINNAHIFYGNKNHQAQKKFSRLIAKIKHEIEQVPHDVDKWYVYSVEDMLENMENALQKPEDITIEMVRFYRKNWSIIKKDFGLGFWDSMHSFINGKERKSSYPIVAEQTSPEEQMLFLNTSNNPKCLGTNIRTNNSILKIGY